MVKMTFTFDEQTVERLRTAAARLRKPQSVVVREAIQDYAERIGRLSEDERRRMLKILDRIRDRTPSRSLAAVKAEIDQIRASRKSGGRRTRPK